MREFQVQTDDFTNKSNQPFRDEIKPILQTVSENKGRQLSKFFNSFCETSITLIPKPENIRKISEHYVHTYKHGCTALNKCEQDNSNDI